MADVNRLFQAARSASAATPDELTRIERRLERSMDQATDVRDLVEGVGEVDAEATRRVAERVQRSALRHKRTRLVGLVAAAAILFMMLPRPTETLDESLVADGVERTLTEVVSLTIDGDGHAAGTVDEPRITWNRGRLELDVVPNTGIDLVVETPEATVSVVGTVFSVDRTPLGTELRVERGAVQVDCHAAGQRLLRGGESLTCWPTTAGGLLGRARTLESSNAPNTDVLATLDVALSTPGPTAIRGEVLARRALLLHDEGEQQEARITAQTYLDEGHLPRRDTIRAYLEVAGSLP